MMKMNRNKAFVGVALAVVLALGWAFAKTPTEREVKEMYKIHLGILFTIPGVQDATAEFRENDDVVAAFTVMASLLLDESYSCDRDHIFLAGGEKPGLGKAILRVLEDRLGLALPIFAGEMGGVYMEYYVIPKPKVGDAVIIGVVDDYENTSFAMYCYLYEGKAKKSL